MDAPDALQRLRAFLLLLALLTAAGVLLASEAPGQEASARVRSFGFTVADLDRSVPFFTEILGFTPAGETESSGPDAERLTGVFGARFRTARLRLGDEVLELTEFLTPEGRPVPNGLASNDLSFQHVAIVVRDMDAAYDRLRKAKVRHLSTAPQTIPEWNQAAAGIRAFYFKDPDGHNLELIWFPRSKGDLRWQSPERPGLFLGIDHSAIAVSDTDQSHTFWRDLLGLQMAGESVNHGTEQEHLNLVFGSRVRITGLRGSLGPGVEYLEYVTPATSRPAPLDLRPCDLLWWQTTIEVQDLDATADLLRRRRVRFVSPGIVDSNNLGPDFRRAVIVKDPDGHGVRLVHRETAAGH